MAPRVLHFPGRSHAVLDPLVPLRLERDHELHRQRQVRRPRQFPSHLHPGPLLLENPLQHALLRRLQRTPRDLHIVVPGQSPQRQDPRHRTVPHNLLPPQRPRRRCHHHDVGLDLQSRIRRIQLPPRRRRNHRRRTLDHRPRPRSRGLGPTERHHLAPAVVRRRILGQTRPHHHESLGRGRKHAHLSILPDSKTSPSTSTKSPRSTAPAKFDSSSQSHSPCSHQPSSSTSS